MAQPETDHGLDEPPLDAAHAPSHRLRFGWFLVRLAPWVLLAGGMTYDIARPEQYSGLAVFSAAPLIAATVYRMRTLVLICLCSLFGTVARHFERGSTTFTFLAQLTTALIVSVLAILTHRVVTRGNVLLASAREIAAAAQRAVLPQPQRRLGHLDVAAAYEAAQAGASIGGDFYAAQDTPYGIRLVVGDVRGKGMGAVSTVAALIGAFREAAEQETLLEGVARRLDRALEREKTARPRPDGAEEFATAVLAELPSGDACVRIVNRGHPPPLLLHPDGGAGEVPVPTGADAALPLGMTGLGGGPARPLEVPFPAGTTLLLFTDGLTEARDRRGVFYDPVAGLHGLRFTAPDALLTALTEQVRRHTGDRAADDLALLAVRRPDDDHHHRHHR